MSNIKNFTVENSDVVDRDILIYVNFENSPSIIKTVKPLEKISVEVNGGYRIKSANPARYEIRHSKTDDNAHIIYPVTPTITTYSILNTLPCSVTLKDKTYPSWSASVSASNTLSKDAQLYADETHDWYIDGAQEENSFMYLMNGSNKVFFTMSVSGNQIIISSL